jgi:hypothetical protein
MTPVTSGGDFGAEKAKQAELGAAGGAVAGPAGEVLGNMIAPQILPEAQRMMDRGVSLLPGQMFGPGLRRGTEQITTSVPFSGAAVAGAMRRGIEDFNRAAYNEALAPIGQKFAGKEVGWEGVDQLEKQLSKEFDRVKGMIDWRPDKKTLADLTELLDLSKEMPADEARRLAAFIKNRVLKRIGPEGVMDGTTFKQVESELSQEARNIYRNPNATAGERQLASGLDSVNAILRDTLERQNPHVRSALQAINTAWAHLVRIRDAAANRVKSLGVFTPGDLLSAERKAAGRRIFGRGEGLMQDFARDAETVLGNRIPDSGTAPRLATMGEITELGGLAVHNPLLAAAQIGAHALHAAAYTAPGLSFLRTVAGAGFPKTRNALAQVPRAAGNMLAPLAGMAAAGGPQ